MSIRSGVYRPSEVSCCERCAFGRGRHAPFCERGPDTFLLSTEISQQTIYERGQPAIAEAVKILDQRAGGAECVESLATDDWARCMVTIQRIYRRRAA